MVRLDATARRVAGVTLVATVVENGGSRQRVRLVDRTGGPWWPPRRRGVPVRGVATGCAAPTAG